ncbi:MAG TPA: hypothetical protein VKX41_04890 [Alloacidobacterium sp.]|nr:hypothetical protein [Alloacidobacterium sp.]
MLEKISISEIAFVPEDSAGESGISFKFNAAEDGFFRKRCIIKTRSFEKMGHNKGDFVGEISGEMCILLKDCAVKNRF